MLENLKNTELLSLKCLMGLFPKKIVLYVQVVYLGVVAAFTMPFVVAFVVSKAKK